MARQHDARERQTDLGYDVRHDARRAQRAIDINARQRLRQIGDDRIRFEVPDRDFLAPGGFVTTLIKSGQQWDAPNGWPPLQWMGVQGVHAYGRDDIATDARTRWLALNRRTYLVTGKMTEKYDVTDLSKRAGGGEYPAQDGFGWTNGVARAMSAQEARQRAPVAPRP